MNDMQWNTNAYNLSSFMVSLALDCGIVWKKIKHRGEYETAGIAKRYPKRCAFWSSLVP